MKRSLPTAICLCLTLLSCSDRKLQTYTANVPQYLSYEELRSPIAILPGRELLRPGKIYFKDSYMFINEYREGIHVVDLSDPKHPKTLAFMEIPGTVDLAIRNEVLYADSYVDLVMIDISDPAQAEELGRAEDVFEYMVPPYDMDYPLDEVDEEKGVVSAFTLEQITREIHHHRGPWPIYYDYALEASSISPGSSASSQGNSYGVGGSMARFLSHGDYLYALSSDSQLKSMDISDPDDPQIVNEQYLWGGIETMFISDGHMYIGSSNGLHILSLSNGAIPKLLSSYQHITACDPVVVSGNRAYVTLRAGNFCGGEENLLEVIDISDKNEPRLLVSHTMTEPYGLGIDNTVLFICEGEHGLKVFDASDPYRIPSRLIAAFEDIHAWDVIPLASMLFLIGDDGFYIYDYSNLQDISLLGEILVAAELE